MNTCKLFKNGEIYGVGIHNPDNSIDLVTKDGDLSFSDNEENSAGDAMLAHFYSTFPEDHFGYTDCTDVEYTNFIGMVKNV